TMSADEVLVRLAEQARSAHGAYLSETGGIDMARLLADGKGHLVKGIKQTAYGRNIEFYDAQAALVHIGKHHKLFTEKVEHEGEVSLKVVYGDDGAEAPVSNGAEHPQSDGTDDTTA